MNVFISLQQEPPFRKLAVKHRPIVADDSEKRVDVGRFMANDLSPADWHRILEEHNAGTSSPAGDGDSTTAGKTAGIEEGKKKILLVDTRNWYESEVGKFSGAIPLSVDRYREAFTALETLLK